MDSVQDPDALWSTFEEKVYFRTTGSYSPGASASQIPADVPLENDDRVLLRILLEILTWPWLIEFLLFLDSPPSRSWPISDLVFVAPDPQMIHFPENSRRYKGSDQLEEGSEERDMRNTTPLKLLRRPFSDLKNSNLFKSFSRNLARKSKISTFLGSDCTRLYELQAECDRIIMNGWGARRDSQLLDILRKMEKLLSFINLILAPNDERLALLYNSAILRNSGGAARSYRVPNRQNRLQCALRAFHYAVQESRSGRSQKSDYRSFLKIVWSNVEYYCSASSESQELELESSKPAFFRWPKRLAMKRHTAGVVLPSLQNFHDNLRELSVLVTAKSHATSSDVAGPIGSPRDFSTTATSVWRAIHTNSSSCNCNDTMKSTPLPETNGVDSALELENAHTFAIPEATGSTTVASTSNLHAKCLLKMDIFDSDVASTNGTPDVSGSFFEPPIPVSTNIANVDDDSEQNGSKLLNKYTTIFAVAQGNSYGACYGLQEAVIRVFRPFKTYALSPGGNTQAFPSNQLAGNLRAPFGRGEFCERIQSHSGGCMRFRVELPDLSKLEPGMMPEPTPSVFIDDQLESQIRMASENMEDGPLYLVTLDTILRADCEHVKKNHGSTLEAKALDDSLARPMLAYTLVKYIWQLFKVYGWISSDWTKYTIYWIGCSSREQPPSPDNHGPLMIYLCSGPYISTSANVDPHAQNQNYSHRSRPGHVYTDPAVLALGITLYEIATGTDEELLPNDKTSPFQWDTRVSTKKGQQLKSKLLARSAENFFPGCSAKVSDAFKQAILACLDFSGRIGGRQANAGKSFSRDVALEESRSAFLQDVFLKLANSLFHALRAPSDETESSLAKLLGISRTEATSASSTGAGNDVNWTNLLDLGKEITIPVSAIPSTESSISIFATNGSIGTVDGFSKTEIGCSSDSTVPDHSYTSSADGTIPTATSKTIVSGIQTSKPITAVTPYNTADHQTWWEKMDRVHDSILSCYFEGSLDSLRESDKLKPGPHKFDPDPELYSKRRVRVAIIDTGCAGVAKDVGSVPFFGSAPLGHAKWASDSYQGGIRRNRIKGFKDFTSENSRTPVDIDGHGTEMAGLLLRMAPRTDLYIARVAKYGKLLTSDESITNIAEAIRHAVKIWKVDFISMSFGFEEKEDKIEKAIREMDYHRYSEGDRDGSGLTIFVATTNEGMMTGTLFPASAANLRSAVLPIRGTNKDGGFVSSMNASPKRSMDKLEFGTYGKNIDVALFTNTRVSTEEFRQQETILRTGCSYATPIAVGWASLYLDIYIQANKDLESLEENRCVLRSREGVYNLFKRDDAEPVGSSELRFIGPFDEFTGKVQMKHKAALRRMEKVLLDTNKR